MYICKIKKKIKKIINSLKDHGHTKKCKIVKKRITLEIIVRNFPVSTSPTPCTCIPTHIQNKKKEKILVMLYSIYTSARL